MFRLSMISAALFFAVLTACGGSSDSTTSTPKVSDAIFSIPASFTGDAAVSRSSGIVKADSTTNPAVPYFALVRDQVRLAGAAARAVKAIIVSLEGVSINGASLFEITGTIEHTDTDDTKLKWAPVTGENNTYTLEKWINVSTTSDKVLELKLTKDGTDYSGYVILNAAGMDWEQPTDGSKNPDWFKIVFDSDSDGNGLHALDIYLQGFRFDGDLVKTSGADDTTVVQNAIMKFTKDSSGVVTLSSSISVPNSRYFVWNGYDNADVLNAASTAETRYYVVTGKADASDRGSINLAMPNVSYTDSTVFNNYAVGDIIQQLITDRLNNNYTFSDCTGSQVLTWLGLSNPATQQVYDALLAQVATHPNLQTLLTLMSVENPVYFNGTTYNSNGATVPAGFFGSTDLASITITSSSDVNSLNIAYLIQ